MPRLAPYAELFKDPKGPGDARPTAVQIVQDQGLVASPEWTGRVVLITGCSPGGLGPETAKAIRMTGADVYMTVRDVAKGKQVADELLADGKQAGKVEIIKMDLGSLESIQAGAQEFLSKSGNKLHVLINNAGVMACPYGKTQDGFETHLGTNHLSHFYLFHQVKNALITSATPAFRSRVVSVSSAAHRRTTIDFTDINFDKREYDPFEGYGQSKLANVHFANELDRRYSQHIRANSLHPGGILTPLARYLPAEASTGLKDIPEVYRVLMSPQQGAATSVWAAVARELEDRGGMYLDEVAEAQLTEPEPFHLPGYASQAFDPLSEKKLWEVSSQLTGISQ